MNDKERKEKHWQAACAALSGILAKYGNEEEFDYYESALQHAHKLLEAFKGDN